MWMVFSQTNKVCYFYVRTLFGKINTLDIGYNVHCTGMPFIYIGHNRHVNNMHVFADVIL